MQELCWSERGRKGAREEVKTESTRYAQKCWKLRNTLSASMHDWPSTLASERLRYLKT